MINKNQTIILGFMVLMIVILGSFVSAETETYPYNASITLPFSCTLNNAIPSGSTEYNISITYPNGSMFIKNQQTNAEGNGAFNYTTNFPITGLYKVRSFCYDGTYSYSNEGYYDVTGNGKSAPDGIVIVLFSIILIILMGAFLVQLILSLGHFASLDLDVMDLAKTMGVYFALLGVYMLSISYVGNPMIEDWLLIFIRVGGFTHLIVPIIGFMLSITVGSLRKKKIDFGTRRVLKRQKIG